VIRTLQNSSQFYRAANGMDHYFVNWPGNPWRRDYTDQVALLGPEMDDIVDWAHPLTEWESQTSVRVGGVVVDGNMRPLLPEGSKGRLNPWRWSRWGQDVVTPCVVHGRILCIV
jgi:hypothetical protein